MKSLPLILFGLTAIAQWAAPLSQIWTREQVLAQGTLIKLKCTAPDPYDPLRGRYLAVRPEQGEATPPKGMNIARGTPVYVTLGTGADGLTTLQNIVLEPPASGDYVQLKTGYTYGARMVVEWPFDRFYVNEMLAPEADKWFAENLRTAKGIIAEVRVLKGKAVLADLSFDGKPLREILKERLKK